MNHERTDQNRVNDRTGDTHRNKWNQRAADRGVVGCFGCDDALFGPGAEFFGCLGHVLGGGVGNDGADIGPDAGQDPDPGADHGRTEHIPALFLPVRERHQNAFGRELGTFHPAFDVNDIGNQLADGKDADKHGQQPESAVEVHDPPGKPGKTARRRIDTRHGHQHAQSA